MRNDIGKMKNCATKWEYERAENDVIEGGGFIGCDLL